MSCSSSGSACLPLTLPANMTWDHERSNCKVVLRAALLKNFNCKHRKMFVWHSVYRLHYLKGYCLGRNRFAKCFGQCVRFSPARWQWNALSIEPKFCVMVIDQTYSAQLYLFRLTVWKIYEIHGKKILMGKKKSLMVVSLWGSNSWKKKIHHWLFPYEVVLESRCE